MNQYLNHKRYIKQKYKDKQKYKTTFLNGINHYKELRLPVPKTILDVGCANGEFLHCLQHNFPKAALTGVDVFQELLNTANEIVQEASYKLCGIPNLEKNNLGKFDVVFCFGVLGVIHDVSKSLHDLLSVTKKGGALLLHNNFNDFPVDIKLEFRKKMNGQWTDWQTGWDTFSTATITELIGDKVAHLEFKKFDPPFAIEPHPHDPVRTWTRKVNDKLELTNGLTLIINYQYLIIIK